MGEDGILPKNLNIKQNGTKEGVRVKILAATDFHGSTKAIDKFAYKIEEEKADIAIICGDITHFGSLKIAINLLSRLKGIRIPILFVPGNCDPPSLAGVDLEGIRCIHGSHELIGDLIFFGVGGCPITPFGTPFEMTEDEIASLLMGCPRDLSEDQRLILVSHTPPKDTSLDITHLGEHVGSISIRRFVEERKPLAVVCGHIHEARGIDRVGDTIMVNSGAARDGNCAIILVEDKVYVHLDSL